jgi:methylamine--corrinoid protein Co-methyltransferase
MTQRGRLVEVLARAETGPIMDQMEFERDLLGGSLKKAITNYGIQFDREVVVNSDDDVADRLFQAGMDVAVEVGFYCSSTNRRIVWSRREIEDGLRSCPSEVTFGEGADSVTFYTRRPEDSVRCGVVGGSYGVPVPEHMYVPMAQSYMKEPLFDAVDNPSIETVLGHPVKGSTVWEVLAARVEASMALAAAASVGRPGMPLGCVQMSPTHLGHLSGATWGAYRPTDFHQVTTISEFKVNYEILSRAVHAGYMGAGLQPYYNPIYGGYVGGADGLAVATVAGLILLNQNACGHVYQTRPTHPFNGCTTSPELIWGSSLAIQALARNTNLIVATLLGPSGGPGTKTMLYENAAFHLANTVSGQGVATGAHSAGGAVPRHASGLDAKIFAEVVRSLRYSGMDRSQANELVKELLSKYESTLDEMPRGRPFEEVYNMDTVEPTPEWQGMYDEVREELIDMGIPLNRLV